MSEQVSPPQEMPAAFHATIIVVATDRSLITLLKMALTVHYSCNVIALNTANGVVTTMKLLKLLKPNCVVLNLQPFDQQALTLVDHLHALKGFERIPILLTHSLVDFNSVHHKPHLILLREPFTLEAFYTAVNTCFGQTT